MTFARSDLLLVAMTFAYWLSFSVLRPLVGPFATTLGASGSEVAIIIGSQSTVAFVVAIPIGALADRFDARRVALGGTVWQPMQIVLGAAPFEGRGGVAKMGVGPVLAQCVAVGGHLVTLRG